MEAQEILALDIGLKHTGIARASNIARIAEPLISVPTDELIEKLKRYQSEHKVEAIAIGLPRNLSGEDTNQTTWIRQWVDKAKQQIAVPLYWQDEALTSRAARLKKYDLVSNADEHTLAAAIILQDFLDSPESERLIC